MNNGTTTKRGRLGAARDLLKGITRAKATDRDILVFGGENIFYEGFDMDGPLRYFERECKARGDSLCLTYELGKDEKQSARGIAEVDEKTRLVKRFWEKPRSGDTTSTTAVPLFYIFHKSAVSKLRAFVKEGSGRPAEEMACGHFVQWLIDSSKHRLHTMRLPSGFGMIGADVGINEYTELDKQFKSAATRTTKLGNESSSSYCCDRDAIVRRAYARVGLMGNPSDGFFGKTIALTIKNYWAEVKLRASNRIRIVPHPLYDPMEFASLSSLHDIAKREGYQGGVRLIMGTCKKFFERCVYEGVALPKRNFTISYDTNIPRQVGLAGSSAIVTATFRCLMSFYGLNDLDIPKSLQPQFVLDVEMQELNINAGLQDRVVQIYEGLVYMDFSKSLVDAQGHGSYVRLDAKLPPLFLAYVADPSDSGKIHNDVRKRWIAGDVDVTNGMKQFAEMTDRARDAIESDRIDALSALMSKNFALRRALYGDKCLGKDNLRMIEIASKCGASAKFPGSGGAVVGTCNADRIDAVAQAYEDAGFVFVRIEPHLPEKH